MKLRRLRISNFQSFGEEPTTIDFESMTFLLGPNGAGKTAVLQALARMFAFDPSLRRVQRADFHVSPGDALDDGRDPIQMWIEAEFEFPETKVAGKHPTIPVNFAHMRLESKGSVPLVRFRLKAQLDSDGEIEEQLHYVLEVDEAGVPTKETVVSKHDRNTIQVHYLPARRDPTDHISYAANSLLGRALRAVNWTAERSSITTLTQSISEALDGNYAVQAIGRQLSMHWGGLHKGTYYANPQLSFNRNELDTLLRHLTVGFTPGHEDHAAVDFSRLSDGQKSLLYLSIVLAMQGISQQVLSGKLDAFDREKLRPAIFTLIAMEEPENSLSPHYLGLIVKVLSDFSNHHDAQAIVATHAPSLLKRVAPESIRYLRLDVNRETTVKTIVMPSSEPEAYKFVREAVQAFPELYFSRLVILGEGDSEEIVLPRLLQARGLAEDDASIAVVPLGGRHVNHFWRLLHGLGIPYVTLLDLDLGRYQGGWGRVRYVLQQLLAFPPPKTGLSPKNIDNLPKWNGTDELLKSKYGREWLKWLESLGVFFSSPLDLDFAMLQQLPGAYGVDDDEFVDPDADTVSAVLGKSHHGLDQYDADKQQYFDTYYMLFKLGSKPATHLQALANLDDTTLKEKMPASIGRLLDTVQKKLMEVPE